MTAARNIFDDNGDYVECMCSRCGGLISSGDAHHFGIGREVFCADCIAEEESEAEDEDCPKCRGGFCSACTGTRWTGVF